eukprot:m.61423 g.61423  ORF g.61423 m.61423 type:complete len:157 (-) comp13878_c0_seq4:512-982(-)
MAATGHEAFCDRPQQAGVRNVLKIILDNGSTVSEAVELEPKAKPAAKKAKTVQLCWKHPAMIPVQTDLCYAVAQRGVYKSQHDRKPDRVDVSKWFDTTARQLLQKHGAAIVRASNQPSSWEPCLTGRQIRTRFERIMNNYKTTQAAEAHYWTASNV